MVSAWDLLKSLFSGVLNLMVELELEESCVRDLLRCREIDLIKNDFREANAVEICIKDADMDEK